MDPRCGVKKNCTPALACASVSTCGSLGMSLPSGKGPTPVPVNVRVSSSTTTDDVTAVPELARSGVT